MRKPPRINADEAEQAYAAAQKVVEIHRRLVGFLGVGQTLGQIDRFVGEQLADLKCKSCFKGYRPGGLPPFPSNACLSVNACVVHGTAGYYEAPMAPGDVLKIDIGVSHRGWIGDAAWTYVFGEPSPDVRKLLDAGKNSLRLGIEQLRPGNTYKDWAKAVQGHVEGDCGLHLVRGLGGHGYGRKLHTPPFVSNVVPTYPGEWPDSDRPCEPGVLIAVEPMIAIGTWRTSQEPGTWPIFSGDGSLAAHHEHDVLITEDGPRVMTEGLDDLPDVILR
jgi:methionyl aminopeptidase